MRWEISPPTDRGNQTCVPISRRRKDTKQRPPHPRAPFDQAQAKGGVSPMRTHLADQWFRSTCRYSSFTETNYADLCCHCSLLLRVWTGRRHTCTPSTALSPSIKCKGLSAGRQLWKFMLLRWRCSTKTGCWGAPRCFFAVGAMNNDAFRIPYIHPLILVFHLFSTVSYWKSFDINSNSREYKKSWLICLHV